MAHLFKGPRERIDDQNLDLTRAFDAEMASWKVRLDRLKAEAAAWHNDLAEGRWGDPDAMLRVLHRQWEAIRWPVETTCLSPALSGKEGDSLSGINLPSIRPSGLRLDPTGLTLGRELTDSARRPLVVLLVHRILVRAIGETFRPYHFACTLRPLRSPRVRIAPRAVIDATASAPCWSIETDGRRSASRADPRRPWRAGSLQAQKVHPPDHEFKTIDALTDDLA
jgi:hypothetical protein